MTSPIGWNWMVAMAIAVWVGWLGPAAAQGIFTCTDSRGKRITSDRPIAECNDREQKELNPSGTLRRNVGPSLTAQERAAEEEREAKAQQERARVNEERRRNRAMLTRYQNQAAHDKERAEALAQVDEVMVAASKRLDDLKLERVAVLDLLDLPAHFIVDGLLHELEAVQVLDLAPRAQCRAGLAHRHVGIAAEAAFLHVAVADADPRHDLVQLDRKSTRLNSSHSS